MLGWLLYKVQEMCMLWQTDPKKKLLGFFIVGPEFLTQGPWFLRNQEIDVQGSNISAVT
jgi:hypothetical protein